MIRSYFPLDIAPSEKRFSYRVETANASTKFIIRDSTSWGVHKEMVC